jgi:hypothetical protein
MDLNKVERLQREHYKDLLRQAEQYRLVQQALSVRSPQPGLWKRVFSWFRQLLDNLGCLLQRSVSGEARRSTDKLSQNPCGEGLS